MPKPIKNKKTEVPQDTSMNDLDFLNDVLLSFKLLVDNYAIALNEASNSSVYDVYLDIFIETSKMQQKIFNLAFKKGWYGLEEEDKAKIKQ